MIGDWVYFLFILLIGLWPEDMPTPQCATNSTEQCLLAGGCNALLLQRRSDQRALMPNCLGRVRIVLPFESRRRKSRNVSQATLSSDFTLCVKKVSIRTSLNGENVCCADTFMGIPMKPIISKKSKLCSKEIGRKKAPPPLYPPLSSCALHWPNRR